MIELMLMMRPVPGRVSSTCSARRAMRRDAMRFTFSIWVLSMLWNVARMPSFAIPIDARKRWRLAEVTLYHCS